MESDNRKDFGMYKQFLMEEGVAPHCKGFLYLNDAIRLYEPTRNIMGLYAEVAALHNTTATRVERAIRHSIQQADEPATNAKFIAARKLVMWT